MAGTNKNSPGSKYDKNIPIRRVPLSEQSQLPIDYSATPGGTLFSTTPGGTRIIYEREFLLQCRDSPLTKSPPPNMLNIPGVTSASKTVENSQNHVSKDVPSGGAGDQAARENHVATAEDAQFQMDI
jgi:hypothetical protein